MLWEGTPHMSIQTHYLRRILKNQEIIMAALDDELASLKATQDTTLATVGTIKTGVDALLAKLAALPTSGLTPAQQAALDAINTEAQAISTAASAINTEVNPPAAKPAP